jgi:hypothetical protein
MANDWILDVLTDLKTYARKNGLSALADQLEETTLIAATEISSAESGAPLAMVRNEGTTGFAY